MAAKSVIDILTESFDFQINQAYNAFERFNAERENGASLSSLGFYIGHTTRLYQGLSYDLAAIEGMRRVENECHFVNQIRGKNGLESAKLQTVIGFYGMNLLKSYVAERGVQIQNRPFETQSGNFDTLVPRSEYTATALGVTAIPIVSRTYMQIKHDVENVVRAKRFDLMKQGMDEVREKYPFRL